ncbi:uncharacterized protein LOC144614024 [Panthera onca]
MNVLQTLRPEKTRSQGLSQELVQPISPLQSTLGSPAQAPSSDLGKGGPAAQAQPHPRASARFPRQQPPVGGSQGLRGLKEQPPGWKWQTLGRIPLSAQETRSFQHPETFVEIYLGGKQNSPLPEVMDTDSRSLSFDEGNCCVRETHMTRNQRTPTQGQEGIEDLRQTGFEACILPTTDP